MLFTLKFGLEVTSQSLSRVLDFSPVLLQILFDIVKDAGLVSVFHIVFGYFELFHGGRTNFAHDGKHIVHADCPFLPGFQDFTQYQFRRSLT